MDRSTDITPFPTPHPLPAQVAEKPPAIGLLYFVEAMGSVGGNLMQVGIFFYTNRRFGWGLRENFTLAAVQGLVYVAGALLAQRLTARFGARQVLAAAYGLVSLCGVVAAFAPSRPGVVVGAVLAYTAVMAVTWPILESLVSSGLDAHALSRRISVYNVVWAGVGALVLAVVGTVIDFWPQGVFVLTAVAHAAAAVLLTASGRAGESGATTPQPPQLHAHPHIDPEPELLQRRTLALWLSRISMPASFALIYALSATLPSLPPLRQIPTWAATLVGSAWLASRWLAFLLLGFSPWWHTRPRALVAAAWVMLLAFAAAAWQPSSSLSLGDVALIVDLGWLVLCQVAIGFAIGLIYSASLYFGMVLSDGSTEHGGYHEALIGLGSILGPGAGAVAQWLRPGDLFAGAAAVIGVLALSTLLASAASVVVGRRGDAA